MIIYKDIITDDEIISDSYDMKEVDGTVYEINTKKVTKGKEDFQLAGANPSAEEEDQGGDDGGDTEVKVYEIEDAFRLKATQFDLKSYKTHLKGYMKAVKTKLQENGADEAVVKEFTTGASAYATKIFAAMKGKDIENFEFFIGESMDPDGMVVLLTWRDDGVTPYAIVWKHGLKETKV